MALPASVTAITVTGTFFETEPEQVIPGVVVTITPEDPGPHRVPDDDVMLMIRTESDTSDIAGEVSVVMAGSNDPKIQPGTLYTVALTGAIVKTYTDVLIPWNAPGGTVDLSSILPGGAGAIGQGYRLGLLTDVDFDPPPEDGDALVFDESDEKWKPGPGGGGATNLNSLTDVDTNTTPPTDGQALVWVDADDIWKPGAVASDWDSITDKPTEFPPEGHSHTAPAWTDVTDKPTEFPPELPIAIPDVTDLTSTLADKAAADHDHVIADTTGLQAALDGKQVLTNAVTVARESAGTWPARPSVEHVTWIERDFDDPLVPAGMLEGDMYEGPDGLAGEVP